MFVSVGIDDHLMKSASLSAQKVAAFVSESLTRLPFLRAVFVPCLRSHRSGRGPLSHGYACRTYYVLFLSQVLYVSCSFRLVVC